MVVEERRYWLIIALVQVLERDPFSPELRLAAFAWEFIRKDDYFTPRRSGRHTWSEKRTPTCSMWKLWRHSWRNHLSSLNLDVVLSNRYVMVAIDVRENFRQRRQNPILRPNEIGHQIFHCVYVVFAALITNSFENWAHQWFFKGKSSISYN